MKRIITSGLLLASAGMSAHAGNCTGSTYQVGVVWSPTWSLSGLTICATATNGDRWQEYHRSDGRLIEYAKGPSDPIDPTHDVGTWSGLTFNAADSTSRATYNYTGGSSYTFEVWQDSSGGSGTAWYYCGAGAGNTTRVATITGRLPGQVACP